MTEYYKLEDFLGVVVVVVDFLSCCNRCLFGFFKRGEKMKIAALGINYLIYIYESNDFVSVFRFKSKTNNKTNNNNKLKGRYDCIMTLSYLITTSTLTNNFKILLFFMTSLFWLLYHIISFNVIYC